jgi:hypothetical protein
LNQAEISITAQEMLAMAPPEVEISPERIKELERLVDNFPWFSCGQLLLLKGMKQHQHPSFNARLLSASLYATSRERLHDYLKQVKVADPQAQNAAAASPNSDGFEVMPFDAVCEKVVEMPPEMSALEPERQSFAKHHDKLIDIFLATQPSPMTPRSDVRDDDLAQPDEKNAAHELVSETLAEIYLAQGLPDKAEQIYSKLSLLYPEKKAYFAARFQSQRAKASS